MISLKVCLRKAFSWLNGNEVKHDVINAHSHEKSEQHKPTGEKRTKQNNLRFYMSVMLFCQYKLICSVDS